MVSGSNSVGAPKQFIAEQRRSIGKRFDSIMAMLCIRATHKIDGKVNIEKFLICLNKINKKAIFKWVSYG